MSISTTPETLLSTSLLGDAASEAEESEEFILEEVEHRLQELARRVILRLKDSYALAPPRNGWDAVRRAEEMIEELIQKEGAQSLENLLKYIDVERYIQEQVSLFAEYVDEMYEAVYSRTDNRGLSELEPALMTLTAVKLLYFVALKDQRALWVAQKAAAILAALRALMKQRRFDIVAQLPQVAQEVLTRYFANINPEDRRRAS